MARPARLARFPYRGPHPYLLTFCTFERRAAFSDGTVASAVLKQFRRTATRFQFSLLAYCLMPDHVHLLVKGASSGSDLQQFAKSAKQSSGQLGATRGFRPLWQEGYHDHVIRPEESLYAMARYVLENPVKAGLVTCATDYPYAGSDTWAMDEILNAAP